MVGGVKNKTMSLFKTSATITYSEPTCVSKLYGRGKKPRETKK